MEYLELYSKAIIPRIFTMLPFPRFIFLRVVLAFQYRSKCLRTATTSFAHSSFQYRSKCLRTATSFAHSSFQSTASRTAANGASTTILVHISHGRFKKIAAERRKLFAKFRAVICLEMIPAMFRCNQSAVEQTSCLSTMVSTSVSKSTQYCPSKRRHFKIYMPLDI